MAVSVSTVGETRHPGDFDVIQTRKGQPQPTAMSSTEPVPGTTVTAELVVGPQDLANSLPMDHGDDFPAVLATARMIALMEIAGSRLLQPFLCAGELSVGVTVDVSHTAPTPPGALVIATARYIGRDAKLFVFEVSASDPGGEIGKGIHKRAIVNSDRLTRAASKRIMSASGE